jgi:Na+-driven multidrug efflux pump
MRSLVLPTVCIIVMPMIWKLDGVWYSLVASEVLAFFVSFGFMIGKRKKYRYG